MTGIHPKTSGAALGAALGVLIVSILGSIHGVHLTAAANASIPSFLGILASWLTPSPATTTTPAPVVVAPQPPVVAQPVVPIVAQPAAVLPPTQSLAEPTPPVA